MAAIMAFVVCGDAVIERAVEKHFAQREEICVDVGLARKGDLGRLVVGAFAEADADAVGEELLDVGLGAVEIGLDDDADGAAHVGARVDAAHDVERDLGEVRVLHVDADEVAGGVGVLGEVAGDGLGQLRRLLEAHLRELDADVGVEVARGDRVEQAGGRPRRRDALQFAR